MNFEEPLSFFEKGGVSFAGAPKPATWGAQAIPRDAAAHPRGHPPLRGSVESRSGADCQPATLPEIVR